MQRGSRCIQTDGHLILEDKYTDRILVPIFFKPLHAIRLFHTIHDCLLHDRLDRTCGKKRALIRCRLRHPELCIPRKKLLPRNCLRPFKQFVKIRSPEATHLQQDTFCCPDKYIRTGNRCHVPAECDSSILHGHDLIAQIQYFTFQHRLQSKMARCDQFIHIFHACISALSSLVPIFEHTWLYCKFIFVRSQQNCSIYSCNLHM